MEAVSIADRSTTGEAMIGCDEVVDERGSGSADLWWETVANGSASRSGSCAEGPPNIVAKDIARPLMARWSGVDIGAVDVAERWISGMPPDSVI